MESRYVGKDDEGFPSRLTLVKPTVKGLWYRGVLDPSLFIKTVAIVGSRKMSRYGKEVLGEIVPRYVAAGYTTISGFMTGIDIEVHRLTMENGGRTVAVLGYGIDTELDSESNKTYRSMMENGGLVLSEYEGFTQWQKWTFPQRNRVVVGLSDMVVLVEARIKSGSLNTADWAIKKGKPVYAVQGPMTLESFAGSNRLISEGKAISLTPDQLLVSLEKDEQYFYSEKEPMNRQKSKLSGSESILIALLRLHGPKTIEELSIRLGKSRGEVSALLTSLLLRCEIKEFAGKWSAS